MAASDSKAPLRFVKKVQFGILSPDEIVRIYQDCDFCYLKFEMWY